MQTHHIVNGTARGLARAALALAILLFSAVLGFGQTNTAANSGFYSQSPFKADTSTSRCQRLAMTSPEALTTLAVGGAGVSISLTTYLPVNYPNSINVTASLEYPSGVFNQLTFRGAVQGIISPGAIWQTDPIQVSIPAKTVFYLRFYFSNNGSPINLPMQNRVNGAQGEWFAEPCSDLTMGQTPIPTSQLINSGYQWAPDWVDAHGTQTVGILVLGDSIAAGMYDDQPNVANGWVDRAFAWDGSAYSSTFALVNWSKPSRQIKNLLTTAPNYELDLLPSMFHYTVCQMVRNDITANRTLAQIQSYMLSEWTRVRLAGSVPIQTTCLPHTLSTDFFMTTTNQTLQSDAVLIQQINAWLRDTGPNGAKVQFGKQWGLVDVAAECEVGGATAPSGLWNAPGGPVYSGTVSSTSGQYTLTDTGAKYQSAWATGCYTLLFTSGALAGQPLEILQIDSPNELKIIQFITGAKPGDTYVIFPAWVHDPAGVHPSAYGHMQIAKAVKGHFAWYARPLANYNGGILAGTVGDPSQNPVSGLLVSLTDTDGVAAGQTTTNSSGGFNFSNLRPGEYTVTITSPYYATSVAITDVLASQTTTLNPLVVPTVGSLTGSVSSNTGQSLPGATIQVLNPAGQIVASGVADSNGNFMISDVPSGTYSATFAASGYTTLTGQSFSVTAGSATLLDATLTSSFGTLAGVVTDQNGLAISGVLVSVTASGGIAFTTSTDSNGNYQLPNLPTGTCTISYSDNGYLPASASATIAGGATTSENETLAPVPGSVSGTVTDLNGNPIEGCTITVTDSNGNVIASATTDVNGNYSIPSLSPETVTATFSETGYVSEVDTPIVISSGATSTANATLQSD